MHFAYEMVALSPAAARQLGVEAGVEDEEGEAEAAGAGPRRERR